MGKEREKYGFSNILRKALRERWREREREREREIGVYCKVNVECMNRRTVYLTLPSGIDM